jgi:peptide/histidine transporter 3/4
MINADSVASFSSNARVAVEHPEDEMSVGDNLRNPLPWYKRKLVTVCLSILVVEMCERLCFYSLSGTQKFLLQTLFGYSNASSSALTNIFSMIVYGSCILGGWIADSYWGRYKTIAVGGSIYAVGAYVGAFATLPQIDSEIMYFIGMFMLVAISSGAIKPNVANLGADQYDTSDPVEAKECDGFFTWFYFVINIGALVAFGIFSNWATAGVGAIPQSYGFFFVFTIAAVAMTLGMVIYFAGSKKYVKKPTEGNSMGALFHYLGEARRKAGFKGYVMIGTWTILPIWFILTIASGFMTGGTLSYVSMVLIVMFLSGAIFCHRDNTWMSEFEDYPAVGSSDFQAAMDAVPTIAIVSTLFNICYNSLSTIWLSQSCQMNLTTGPDSQLSAAVLNTADCVAILLFTPIYTFAIQPLYRKCTGKDISRTMAFATGLTIGAAACVVAGLIETARVDSPLMGGFSANSTAPYNAAVPASELPYDSNYRSLCSSVAFVENGQKYHMVMSDMTVWWMLIPYLMIGIGEVFVNAGMYAFTYSNTPTSMRSLMQAFTLLCQGTLSNGITASLSIMMAGWVPDDINYGHLSHVNYVYGAVTILGIPLYLFVSRTFVQKDFSDNKV